MHNIDYRKSMGRKVREERRKHGWTQEELAERTELHASFIGQIERGLKAPSFDTLKRLSQAFGVKPSDLLAEGGPQEPRKEAGTVERKIAALLKGYSTREQEAIYQTIRHILRTKRKLK